MLGEEFGGYPSYYCIYYFIKSCFLFKMFLLRYYLLCAFNILQINNKQLNRKLFRSILANIFEIQYIYMLTL